MTPPKSESKWDPAWPSAVADIIRFHDSIERVLKQVYCERAILKWIV